MTPVLPMPAIGTPAGSAAAMRTITLVQRLLALDDVWTAQLEAAKGGGPVSNEDVEVAATLVADMQAGLDQLQSDAEVLSMILQAAGSAQFEDALAALAGLPGTPDDLVEVWEASLPDFTLWSASIEACQYLRDEAPAEKDLLAEKLERLRRGEVTEGDFRFPVRCAMHLMLAGGTVIATVGLGGAPAFVLLGASCAAGQAVMGWKDGGCPRILPEISRGRR